MRPGFALLVVTGGLACSYPNPDFDLTGSTGGSGTSVGASGSDLGPGAGPGPDATGPDTTQGATTLDSTVDGTADTADETATETEGRPGCTEQSVPGEVCHDDDVLPLPDGCVPYPVLIADLDQDGAERDDVIVACANGPLVYFPGMDVGYGPWELIHMEVGDQPRDLAVADLNGDDNPDVVLIDESPSDGVRVYYRADVGFTYEGYDAGSPAPPTRVAVGAWLGQAPPDLLVTLPTTMEVKPIENDGMFTPAPTLLSVSAPRDVAMGFLNNDNTLDVAVVSGAEADGAVNLMMGNGTGAAPATPYPQPGRTPNAVIIDDLDTDSINDIAFTYGGMVPGVGILYRTEQGDVQQAFHGVGEQPLGLASGDFDADEQPDLVLADGAGDLIFLFADPANGSWSEQYFGLESEPFAVAAGYIDADDHADVVVSLPTAGEVVILQSSP